MFWAVTWLLMAKSRSISYNLTSNCSGEVRWKVHTILYQSLNPINNNKATIWWWKIFFYPLLHLINFKVLKNLHSLVVSPESEWVHEKSQINKWNIASGSPPIFNSYYNSESPGIKFIFVFYIKKGFAKISCLKLSRKETTWRQFRSI